MAYNAGSSTLNGDSSVGFSRACINLDAEISVASAEDVLGISTW